MCGQVGGISRSKHLTWLGPGDSGSWPVEIYICPTRRAVENVLRKKGIHNTLKGVEILKLGET